MPEKFNHKRIGVAVYRFGMSAAALLLSSTPALSAGFALKEQSALALGSAFAGATAGAEDLGHAFFNPAALSRFDGINAQIVTSYIRPVSELKDAESSNAANVPLGGARDDSDVGEDALVPAFYASGQINERLRAGLAINVPFGLETKYDDGWAGRYHAVKSQLLTVAINPILAVDLAPWLSLGGGPIIQYADAEISQAIDFGTIFNGAGGVPGQDDGFGKLTGDDFAYGFSLGLLAEPWEGTRFGVGYRSEISHNLTGDAEFSLTGGALDAAIAGSGAFVNTGGRARLDTPASVNFGVFHEINERWAVMGEAQWTDWSTFEELRVEYDNNNQPDTITKQDWSDQWFLAAGARYMVTEDLGLRFGVAYDQSPVKNSTRTPRIPDNDRYWIAAGLNWSPLPAVEFAAGFTHIFVDDSEIRLRTNGADDNAARGNLDAEYESFINILTVSAKIRF
jgi:long-chain fatty acid transport protein